MTQKTLISLIIPTYNYLDNLECCLESVLSQLPGNCECIVVDDGSDEVFRNALKSYENASPGLSVYYGSHKGASAARNKGISLARGQYVAFLDADDVLHQGFFDSAVALLEKDADLYIFSIEPRYFDNTEDNNIYWVKA